MVALRSRSDRPPSLAIYAAAVMPTAAAAVNTNSVTCSFRMRSSTMFAGRASSSSDATWIAASLCMNDQLPSSEEQKEGGINRRRMRTNAE